MFKTALFVIGFTLAAAAGAFVLGTGWWLITLTDYDYGRTVGGFTLVIAAIVFVIAIVAVIMEEEDS